MFRDLSIQQGGQQRVTQDVAEVLGHYCLLLHTAVILQGQDDGEVRRLLKQDPTRGYKSLSNLFSVRFILKKYFINSSS